MHAAGQTVDAMIVRPLPDGFAVQFDDSLNARIDMIRSFYAGDYIARFMPSSRPASAKPCCHVFSVD